MSAHIALPTMHTIPHARNARTRHHDRLLRDSLGFRGVVVTDAMDMRGVGAGYDVARSSVLAVQGRRRHPADAPRHPPGHRRHRRGGQRGEIPAERIAASVRRILEMKLRTGAIQRPIVPLDSLRDVVGQRAHRARAQQIAEDAVTLLRDTPASCRSAPRIRRSSSPTPADNDVAAGRTFTAEMRAALPRCAPSRITPATPRARLDSLLRRQRQRQRVVIATFVRTIEGEGRFAVAQHVARSGSTPSRRAAGERGRLLEPVRAARVPAGERLRGGLRTRRGGGACRSARPHWTHAFRGVPPTSLPGYFVAGQPYERPLPALGHRGDRLGAHRPDARVRDSVFPGGIAVIGTRTDVVAEVAVGKLDWTPDAPTPDAHTIWDIASLTKVVGMTTAMMQMVEQGLVQLDAPVQRYLPEWTGANKERVTVRHLLTHTSGLPAHRTLWLESETAAEARRSCSPRRSIPSLACGTSTPTLVRCWPAG
jgi:hypothetical protein